jgi:hypothetical protein
MGSAQVAEPESETGGRRSPLVLMLVSKEKILVPTMPSTCMEGVSTKR